MDRSAWISLGPLRSPWIDNPGSPWDPALSLRTSRNTRASRRMRSTLVPPPLPAMNPISVVAMQKKSKQFHRWAKYTVGYVG